MISLVIVYNSSSFSFSLQRTKGKKAVEWLVKKSQVLGEIGRHRSIIGLGKALLNPCLDGRTECEIWEVF